jgi:hypothetical protein
MNPYPNAGRGGRNALAQGVALQIALMATSVGGGDGGGRRSMAGRFARAFLRDGAGNFFPFTERQMSSLLKFLDTLTAYVISCGP